MILREKKILIETVSSTHSQPDHLISKFEYKYNFDSQVAEVIEYNDENEIISTSEEKLDTFKSILEIQMFKTPTTNISLFLNMIKQEIGLKPTYT